VKLDVFLERSLHPEDDQSPVTEASSHHHHLLPYGTSWCDDTRDQETQVTSSPQKKKVHPLASLFPSKPHFSSKVQPEEMSGTSSSESKSSSSSSPFSFVVPSLRKVSHLTNGNYHHMKEVEEVKDERDGLEWRELIRWLEDNCTWSTPHSLKEAPQDTLEDALDTHDQIGEGKFCSVFRYHPLLYCSSDGVGCVVEESYSNPPPSPPPFNHLHLLLQLRNTDM